MQEIFVYYMQLLIVHLCMENEATIAYNKSLQPDERAINGCASRCRDLMLLILGSYIPKGTQLREGELPSRAMK